MTIIPFDPKRRPARRDDHPAEIERANERIAMLERTLMNTLRENARNWARAERAEAMLAELERRDGRVPIFIARSDEDPRPSA
ncbi:MAG: hypothetical protein AAF565_15775 [Pseudomonadota bacterium]